MWLQSSNWVTRVCQTLAVLGWVVTTAALAQDPGKHALDYTYAEGSPQYWRGMHSTRPGNFVFRKDPHVWVVTPDFAKKAGMPLEWASEELQGVTAAAWRMQPGEEQCGWGGNPNACKRDMVCTLDLYFDRQTQALPWAPNRPVADFYWQDVSSAWHLLPSLGWAKEENGDVARGSKSSQHTDLGKSPFADPKTGEELKWAPAGGPTGTKGSSPVLAYDREMHARYAFVQLMTGCGRSPWIKNEVLELMSFDRAWKVTSVHRQMVLPESWIKRLRERAQSHIEQTQDFYQNTWKQLNK